MNTDVPIRVLVIDDAPVLRRLLALEFGRRHDFTATACSSDLTQVSAQLTTTHPDAIVLNLEVVQTDAAVLVRKLREHYPVPIVAYAPERPTPAMRNRTAPPFILEVVAAPNNARLNEISAFATALLPRVRAAVVNARPVRLTSVAPHQRQGFRGAGVDPSRYLIVCGASTGGTEALFVLLSAMPPDSPPIVIVQHMPAGFTRSFAERLNMGCALRVSEAVDGEPLRVGCALLARGDTQLAIRPATSGWVASYTHQQRVSGHCPSVDVLFNSAAAAGKRAIGVLLTGMGSDGAAGLLAIYRNGGLTLAQSADSCVVYGMPRAAVECGAVQVQAAPHEIPGRILGALRSGARPMPAAPALKRL